jgi:RNA polymerase sigma-70 factor (ECF subfamily)
MASDRELTDRVPARERESAHPGPVGCEGSPTQLAVTDQELIDRCLEGDTTAFDLVVQRHQDSLFRHLLRLSGSREQAEDLCQEAFVKLYQVLPRFRRGSAIPPLLFRIATNLWRDGRPRDVTAAEPTDPDGVQHKDEVPNEVLRRLEHQAIRAALRDLRPEYREVLSLRFDRGLSYREIALVTGVRSGTVGTWIHRALDCLRAALSHQEQGEAEP